MDGARPGDVDGGPAPRGEADGLVAPSLLLRLLLGGVMLLHRTAAAPPPPLPPPPPPPCLLWRLGLEPTPFLSPDCGGGLVVAASAAAGDGGRLPNVSSFKDRSSFTYRKVGKGRARRSRAPTCVKRSLR
jgi:hypothetical protein